MLVALVTGEYERLTIFNFLQTFSIILWAIAVLAFLPQAAASPEMMPFPLVLYHPFQRLPGRQDLHHQVQGR